LKNAVTKIEFHIKVILARLTFPIKTTVEELRKELSVLHGGEFCCFFSVSAERRDFAFSLAVPNR